MPNYLSGDDSEERTKRFRTPEGVVCDTLQQCTQRSHQQGKRWLRYRHWIDPKAKAMLVARLNMRWHDCDGENTINPTGRKVTAEHTDQAERILRGWVKSATAMRMTVLLESDAFALLQYRIAQFLRRN